MLSVMPQSNKYKIVKVDNFVIGITSILESLKGLVGERNAQRGSIKFFEAMQDDRLNKHLFYVCTF